MEGLDEGWTLRKGIDEVSYTKMPPGEYAFRIMAANNDGVWNPAGLTIPILIRPPFWQRSWFYFLLGAIAAGIIYSIYSYRLKHALREKLLIGEQERMRIESEKLLGQLEMKALRAQMNPHFIFNCLNSINRFIVVNDNDAASGYLTKFSRLIRQVLDNSRGEKVILSAEIDTLQLYIDMESLRFMDKFESLIEIDPALKTDAFVIQPMLIQPYVENAIWHGLMHRKTKGRLRIQFLKQDQSLVVIIEDNGVGRTQAKAIKDSQLINRKSHGMKVTAERMSLLSRQLNVPVEANVEDLYDDMEVASGTRVRLILPLEPVESSLSHTYEINNPA
jgi:LytS/YehU family sensor histidine kinase